MGYERYGQQSDLEHFEMMQRLENCLFPIEEVAWVCEGPQSKADRVQRPVPDLKGGRMCLPFVVWYDAKVRYWKYHDPLLTYEGADGIERAGDGKIHYVELQGETRARAAALKTWQKPLVIGPIRKLDHNRRPYDLTVALINELLYFPFGRYNASLRVAAEARIKAVQLDGMRTDGRGAGDGAAAVSPVIDFCRIGEFRFHGFLRFEGKVRAGNSTSNAKSGNPVTKRRSSRHV